MMNLTNPTPIKLLLLGLVIILIYFGFNAWSQKPKNQPTPLPSFGQKVSVSGVDSLASTHNKNRELSVLASTPKNHDQAVLSQTHKDTQIDGALIVGEDGQLMLNQGVRDFFDYFLSAADEIGPEAAIAHIQRYIENYLPSPASDQANSLLWSYLHYKKYELSLQQQPLTADLISQLDALVVLRENFDTLAVKRAELFSVEADQALFGLEKLYQEHTLSTLELFADQSISQQERQTKLERLQESLPPELQASHDQDQQQRQQQQTIEKITASNADDSSFHQALLDQGLEQQKADELLSYRQQQVQFESLYWHYRTAVSKLNKQDKNYPQKQASLRKTFFSLPEQQTLAKLRDLREDQTK